MAKLLFLAAAACFLALVASEKVDFKDCGSKVGKVKQIEITPCSSQPCPLKRGTEEVIEVTFSPAVNITKATTVVYGKLGPVPVPFPVPNSDACSEQGLTCPLEAGKEYVFKTTLPIKSAYPKVSVVVEWELKDQNGDLVYCWEVPAKIVD